MVATLTALGMAGAVAAHHGTRLIPQLNKDPQVDAAIKAALGLLVVIASAWIKDPKVKIALLALGVGVGSAGALAAYQMTR